ncbi:META domain-containing protein [Phytoactinopolyspora halotolerans]|uniref:META domain-containing protein n=1 Tax=Phytoactinopolyspora halotolerans TaxID=1981512 RepID=A0A6L9S167_9ACTN|nr:META domain-containing protein [Phytoactinopolyspora halotolerans]NED98802.1 META domain-containing protein [Phytoactinopolyspora halotolerans]
MVAAVATSVALTACGNGEDDDTTVVPEDNGSGSETEGVPVVGTTWKLHNVASVDDLPSDPPAEAMFVIEDGEVSGNTGCNSFGGDAEVDEEAGTVTFSQVIATTKACTGERGEIDQAMLGALEGEATIEISGDVLTLTPESGNALELRATDQEPPTDAPEDEGSPDADNAVDDSEDGDEEPPTISFNEDVPSDDE